MSAPATNGRTAAASDRAAVVRRLRASGVRTVVLGGSDTNGILRGKRVPLDELPRALEHGVALCEAIWALGVDERVPVDPPPGHAGWFPGDGYPDVIAVPDPGTARVVPWQAHTALALCDFHHRDGAPVAFAPRGALRGVVERAEALGYEPVAGLELECYLLRETPASAAAKRPAELASVDERPSAYGALAGSRETQAFVSALGEHLLGYGLPVQTCHLEAGPGQLEVTLRRAPALEAADHAVLLKAAIKALALDAGLLATFMAKPRTDWPGSSCHLHLSLRAGGRDAFHDAGDEHGMSAVMRRFTAGLLAAMPELTALMAPTPNAYRRFRARSWAATTATWSPDNRSAGLRVVGDGPGSTRVEHRQPGADANPYLATAAALAAGLEGVARELPLPAPARGDLYARPTGALPGFPRTLEAATELLAASALAHEWLGAELVAHFVAMRRAELDAQAEAVTDWETSRYLEAL